MLSTLSNAPGMWLKRVGHLLLLELQLVVVRNVLEFATATHAEMLTHWLGANFTWLYQIHNVTLAKAVFLAVDFHIGNIARSTKWYKHHQVVPASDAFTLGCHFSYLKPFYYGQIFSFSTQNSLLYLLNFLQSYE